MPGIVFSKVWIGKPKSVEIRSWILARLLSTRRYTKLKASRFRTPESSSIELIACKITLPERAWISIEWEAWVYCRSLGFSQKA